MRIETRHAIHYEQAKALGHDDLRRHFVMATPGFGGVSPVRPCQNTT